MSDENAFLAVIKSAPNDNTARLVFADWLAERGDPRAELLRTHLSSLIREGRSFEADRPVFSSLLGTEVTVSVWTNEAEVQNDQAAALAGFLAISPDQRATLPEPLFENYLSMLEATGEGPAIADPEQVWAFVRWTNVIVPLQGPNGHRFVFVQGDPAWEQEHGVETLFRDEQLIHLDQASGAFLSSCFWDWE